jgi:hypothetical protein
MAWWLTNVLTGWNVRTWIPLNGWSGGGERVRTLSWVEIAWAEVHVVIDFPLVLHWSWGSNVYLCWRRCYREWKIPRAAPQQWGVSLYKMYTWFTSNMHDETPPPPPPRTANNDVSCHYFILFSQNWRLYHSVKQPAMSKRGKREGARSILRMFYSFLLYRSYHYMSTVQINSFSRSPSHSSVSPILCKDL